MSLTLFTCFATDAFYENEPDNLAPGTTPEQYSVSIVSVNMCQWLEEHDNFCLKFDSFNFVNAIPELKHTRETAISRSRVLNINPPINSSE